MDVSNDLISAGDNITSSSAFVELSDNNSVTVSFPSGVGITINITAGLLVYTLEVPSSLEGTTSGLLGNYNGDDSDEFVFRNSTMISNSSSDSEIHQFGQSCKHGTCINWYNSTVLYIDVIPCIGQWSAVHWWL